MNLGLSDKRPGLSPLPMQLKRPGRSCTAACTARRATWGEVLGRQLLERQLGRMRGAGKARCRLGGGGGRRCSP